MDIIGQGSDKVWVVQHKVRYDYSVKERHVEVKSDLITLFMRFDNDPTILFRNDMVRFNNDLVRRKDKVKARKADKQLSK